MSELTEPELAAWYPYLVYSGALLTRLDAELRRDCGITHVDYGVLMQLGGPGGDQRRMGDIGATLAVEPSVLTYRIDRLVSRGFVERRRDDADGRVINIRITRKGLALLRQAARLHSSAVRRLFLDRVDPDALVGLTSVFWPLHDHLVGAAAAPLWASRLRPDPTLSPPHDLHADRSD
jgi:DNA-binding MarR family transcriptional regulator